MLISPVLDACARSKIFVRSDLIAPISPDQEPGRLGCAAAEYLAIIEFDHNLPLVVRRPATLM
jgi:hypothetical protein